MSLSEELTNAYTFIRALKIQSKESEDGRVYIDTDALDILLSTITRAKVFVEKNDPLSYVCNEEIRKYVESLL